MCGPSVLISGGGIAGATLASRLAAHGLRPTVVERAAGQRSSGNPVDVRGAALPVVERMGVLPELRAARTGVDAVGFVDARGRVIASLPMASMQGTAGAPLEVPRADLAAILLAAARRHTEMVWGDSIATLHQDPKGVDVTFERSAPRRFDFVVGADGLHSTVRRLAFGPESRFVRPTGLLVATVRADGLSDVDPAQVLVYNRPGRMVSIHPCAGTPRAAFIFRSGEPFDHRDTARHRDLLAEAYAGMGWRTSELLDRVRRTEDLYLDAVSMVDIPSWTQGRVALLGDAASSLSLFGDGSSLAIAGAATLADRLAERPHDPVGALAVYERTHRARIRPARAGFRSATRLLVPATRPGLAVRNGGLRLWAARLNRPAGRPRRSVRAAG